MYGLSREMLLYKILRTGIDGKMYFAIKSLYKATESSILVNNNVTEWFSTIQGVRQGDSLSPTMFNIFINDLACEIKRLNVGVKVGPEIISILLYADDVVILSENTDDMQTLIDHVNSWCKKWKMKVNLKKSKVVHFRKQGEALSDIDIKLGNDTLSYVSQYKYLGVYFDEYLDFTYHSRLISESGSRALGALIAKFKSSNCIGYESYKKLYETCVQPILNYGAEVWGYSSETKTTLVQNRAMRVFLGVNQRAPNIGMLGDLGWIPHCNTKHVCLLRYWNKLIDLDENRLTKRVFNTEYQVNGKWSKSVKKVLSALNMNDVYDEQTTCDLSLCKDRLFSNFEKNWFKEASKKPKLRTYCTYKNKLEPEKYVITNLAPHERSILAQFRLGTLPLEIELGRFASLKCEERICKLCNDGSVEDEIHLLFNCKTYAKERKDFFEKVKVDTNNDVIYNLKYLFIEKCRQFAKYLSSVMEIRRSKLN